ncbi:uncharacterized protein [Solanum tuberosum]|uniref:uncharacterized protein n=1 Tax=Solanum tuberosum TaxID=4113 RepID=UPI00073A27EF|nr:PREDICTED: uncharacterized protein LOC107058411 [Solanum tuberosum]
MSPYELMYGKQSSLTHLRVIGCLAFATSLRKDDKFAPKARKAVLLGYDVNLKGYKLLDIESRVIFVSRDVIFYEKEFSFQTSGSGDTTNQIFSILHSHVEDCKLTPCVDDQASMHDVLSQNQTPPLVLHDVVELVIVRRSNRPAKPPLWHTYYVLPKKLAGNCLYPIGDIVDYESISPAYRSFVTKLSQEKEPASYQEAIQNLD